jgi:phytoene/squalene synthetase
MDVTPDRSDALELIRAHCDRGLRYYTWALERMPSIPEQAPRVNQVRSALSALAHILAYVEGAEDERQAMTLRDEDRREICKRGCVGERWQPSFVVDDA